jgi:hypothetical protein
MHIRRKAEASVAKRRRTRIISVLLGVGGPFLEDPFILTMVVWFYGFYMDGVLLSSSIAHNLEGCPLGCHFGHLAYYFYVPYDSYLFKWRQTTNS